LLAGVALRAGDQRGFYLNEIEKALLGEVTGGVEPLLCLRTNTKVDAGRWWRRTPVWLCVTQDNLILLAVARRRYVQKVPLGECCGSLYCNTTGELILAPAKGLETSRLAMSPADALKVLKAIGCEQKMKA